MTGIRVELQLKDGSFTSGMLRSGQTVQSFRSELSRLDPHFRKLESNGRGAVTSIRRLDTVNRDLLSTLRDVSIVSGGVTMMFRGITGASGGLVGSITRVNAEMERLKYQMLGMSNSAEPMREAAASVDYLRQKAMQMPFSLGEIANSFVKLKATGTDPMAGSLQAVADGIAAFGGSDEQLHRVTLGLVQMSGKSVIQMEEMRQQLGESMPNAMRIMARSMGVSVAELTKAISTGRVEASTALNAFYAELERTYGGEAQRMMETFSGQVSQLRANLQLLATGDGMKGFFEEQKAGLIELNDFLQSDDAKKFAEQLGNALTAMVRGIRVATKTAYELREEITMVAKAVAAGFALRMLGSIASKTALNIRFAALAVGGLRGELVYSGRALALASTALTTYGNAGRAAGLALFGVRAGIVALGSATIAAAPWIFAIGTAIALAGKQMGWFGNETSQAYDQLVRFGAESKSQAEQILKDKEAELRAEVAYRERVYNLDKNKPKYKAQKLESLNAARAALDEFLASRDGVLARAEETSADESIRRYDTELQAKLRVFNEDYRKRQVDIDKAQDLELAKTATTGRKAYQITEEFQAATFENRKKRQEAVLALIDEEINRVSDLQQAAVTGDRSAELGNIIDFLRAKRIEAYKEMQDLAPEGITFVADIENEEEKVKRGSKLLDDLQAKVKGLQAEMIGAGNAFAKMQFEIARGDYGSIEEGGQTVRELHEALLAATAQKEALDLLMKGDEKAEKDIETIRMRALERQMELRQELADENMSDAEKFRFRLDSGYYDGLGPMENIRKGIMSVVGAVDSQGEAMTLVGQTMRENTFGQQTVDRINATAEALDGILQKITGIGSGLTGISFGGILSGRATRATGRNGSMLDLIAGVESGGDGYNATLDNGRWTGGQRNLTSMTLNQILELQKEMLANPENRALYGNGSGSSALGRYQIVSKTLMGLIKEMGLSGGEFFDEKMQDAMASRLLARRGDNLVGLRQEWAGLKNVSDADILAALGRDKGVSLNPGAGSLPPLPVYDRGAMEANRAARTEDLRNQASGAGAIEEENRDLEFQLARKKELERLVAAISGATFETEGLGSNFSAAIAAIEQGKFGDNRDTGAAEYKEILKTATELDQVERRITERNNAERQSKEQLKSLEEERATIAQRIADEQERIKNPDYVGESNDLRKLIEDLDQYVARVKTAYGESSQQFRDAQAYRTSLLGQQRALDATLRQSDMATELRDLQDGLLGQSQLRRLQFERDVRRVEDWVAAARQAGLDEVEIVRQAEEMKAAIRDQYERETNPIKAQMEDWKDYSGAIMRQTAGWTENMASGITGLITGTGDLHGAVSGMLNDVVNNQVKFLMSSLGGDKLTTGASMAGGKGKTFPVAHTGGIIGGSLGKIKAHPGVFTNAPKFHTGGIIGMPRLKKDEVPIIGKKKEGVFTEEQMAALAPAGSGGIGAISISAPVTVNATGGKPDENADLAKRISREMEATMRGVVVSELTRQLRAGNLLNRK